MDSKLVQTVKMFGPSISNPSRVVNRDVPVADVEAYKAAGYQFGSINEIPEVEEEKPKGKVKK